MIGVSSSTVRSIIARCPRWYVGCDMYKPARRDSSPTSHGLVHASALVEDHRLVLHRERSALGVRDQLRVTHPLVPGDPCGAARPPARNSSSATPNWSSRPEAAVSTAELDSCPSPCPAFFALVLEVIDS